VGEVMLVEVLWRAESASPLATARTIHNQAPKQGWSSRCILLSPDAHHNT